MSASGAKRMWGRAALHLWLWPTRRTRAGEQRRPRDSAVVAGSILWHHL